MESESFFDDLAFGAEPGDDKPYLIEVGRRLDGAQVRSRLFRWAGTSLVVSLAPAGEWVRVRDTEEEGDGLTLTREELRALGTVCEDWTRRRDSFWTFAFQGHWTGSGRYHYFIEPGGRGERVQVAEAWRGSEAPVTLAVREVLIDGAVRVADLVHVGEAVGPADGVRVGAEYVVNDLRVIARRERIEIERAATGARLVLGPSDHGLPQELLTLSGPRA